MSKRDVQATVNNAVLKAIESYNACDEKIIFSKRLRFCNAIVWETPNWYVLKSYNTVIALIDKRTDTLYDFLRLVYGYTSTSAQHISKFEKDYCQGKWNCAIRLTYRDI